MGEKTGVKNDKDKENSSKERVIIMDYFSNLVTHYD